MRYRSPPGALVLALHLIDDPLTDVSSPDYPHRRYPPLARAPLPSQIHTPDSLPLQALVFKDCQLQTQLRHHGM